MFKLAKIAFFTERTYRRITKTYVWPTVKIHYDRDRKTILEEIRVLQPQGIKLLIDGQFDSPGFCAKMCCVTAIESSTGYIVAAFNLVKSMTGKIS